MINIVRFKSIGVILAFLLATYTSSTLGQKKLVYKSEFGIYNVRMVEPPVISNIGANPNFAATKPERGAKINKKSSKVMSYRQHLRDQHDQVLEAVGVPTANKVYDNGYATNSFTVKMNFTDAQKLAKQPGVASVTPVRLLHLQGQNGNGNAANNDAGNFLGVSGNNSLRNAGYTGKDVIIGLIDSGIWPEHPSFADDGTYGPLPAGSFSGTACQFGTSGDPLDAPFQCNNKLLQASVYNQTCHLIYDPIPVRFPDSARDGSGHGTATSAIAAGNDNINAIIFGGTNLGTIAGIAPRARLSIYNTNCGVGVFNSDMAAAVDQAVADGVDVISMSIGGIGGSSLDDEEISLLFANDAGIPAAIAAGNNGPDPSTVLTPSRDPWVLSVAAGTIDRIFTGNLLLQNGARLSGLSVNGPSSMGPLVLGGDCSVAALSNLQLTNKIVVCDATGLTDFPTIRFPERCAQKGAIGEVTVYLTSPFPNMSVDSFIIQHIGPSAGPIPSIVLGKDSSDKLLKYMASTPTPQASLGQGGLNSKAQGSVIAVFSSRGDTPFMEDIIKPDLTAPGALQVLTAIPPIIPWSQYGNFIPEFGGTSAATPHAAGVMALVKQAHPDWTAAMIKSALMTTSRQDVTKEDGKTPADPFDMGAGYLQANGNGHQLNGSVIDPGLVYDAGFYDYLAFLCGTDFGVLSQNTCNYLANNGYSLDPSNLNLPSIGISKLPGIKTITRTVTNVAGNSGASRFDINVKAPDGYKVEVNPNVLNVNPGQTATYTVTFTNINAPIGVWRYGSLTLKGKDKANAYQVFSPIAVNAILLDTTLKVAGTGTAGSLSFPVTFGYNGNYVADLHGLAAPQTQTGEVTNDPNDLYPLPDTLSAALALGSVVSAHPVSIPAGTAIARFETFDAFTTSNADLDMYVYDPNGNLVDISAIFGTDEKVELIHPAPGTYTVVMYGYDTSGPPSDFTLYTWVAAANVGNATVSAPASATLGSIANIQVNWTGLSPNSAFLGAINHLKDGNIIGTTIINIDTALIP